MAPRLRQFLLVIIIVGLFSSSLSGQRAAAATPEQIVDDFEATLRSGVDGNNIPVGWFVAQDGGSTTTFARTDTPPAAVPGAPSPNQVLKVDFNVSAYGVVIHAFENASANTWVNQDWSNYAGLAFWLYGENSGTDLFIDVIDNRTDGSTRDDGERYTVSFEDNFNGWRYMEFPFSQFTRKEIGNGAPADGFTLTNVHGWAFGSLTTTGTRSFYLDDAKLYGTAPPRPLELGFSSNSFGTPEGRSANVTVRLSKAVTETVTVQYATADGSAVAGRDYTPASGTLTFAPGVVAQSFSVMTLEDSKFEGGETVLLRLSNPSGAGLGLLKLARLSLADNDTYDPLLIDDFELNPDLFEWSENLQVNRREIEASSPQARPGQDSHEGVLSVGRTVRARPGVIARRFAAGENWAGNQGLALWVYGQNSNRPLKLYLYDNKAADQGPAGWQLAWRDEFNSRAGTPPDPNTWSYEIGDGTINSIPGWGNSELQYYSSSTQNAAMDGRGNLLITARATTPESAPECYYGPCQYTSARLISANKAEFAYGRIEARIKVPRGSGLWPAFWSLGTDIGRVGWPQTGEIDIMEHVGREPYRVFGTLHGPGYSGGSAFGDTYDFTQPVADRFHTYTIEWQPNHIVWYVDGIKYHEATPANVAPNQWVYNHPFFLLLNLAVGGNFGGPVGDDAVFPQSMAVDYVRVYQSRDTAERFEASVTDNFSGWRRIEVPFSAFTRSKAQPQGAPNDGLTLSSVHGYGFELPKGQAAPLLIDQVRLRPNCAETITVTSAADSGAGSLREAIARVCPGGTIDFSPNLVSDAIELTSAPLTISRTLTINGPGADKLSLSGGTARRVLEISASGNATVRGLTIHNGYGFELAGGVLNNGTLTLERVVVDNNRVTTSGADYWKGGAGIYSGDGSTLTVRDSTISNNTVEGADGGGIFGFLNAQVTIERSTLSSNTSSNVGGALRSLGNATIVNSTLSGNGATGWHGGAIFHTDGAMEIRNSTIASNSAPAGTAGGLFVGTFNEGSPRLTLTNSIIADNSNDECIVGRFGPGAVTLTSGGHNLASDATCGLTDASDQPGVSPNLATLANNGGPTQTHALPAGSPALDTTDLAACPATDQRGVARPQGAGCDSGAYERAN